MARPISPSVSVSTLLVASSRMTTSASVRRQRAMARSCFWPLETPSSVRTVS